MYLLSGDQAQCASLPGALVNRLSSVPSGLIVKISKEFAPPISRLNPIRSPDGDQNGKLSLPLVSSVMEFSAKLRMRSPLTFSDHTRYTMRLPSAEKLGKPAFRGPLGRSRFSEPSGRIIIRCAGSVARAWKKPPYPNTIHWPSGDQAGEKAPPPGCRKAVLRLEPSISLT